VPLAKNRSWNDVLDNLGENLVRLGTSLTALSENSSAPPNDVAFSQSMERIATGFRLAFRQARPALDASEKPFRQLTRASIEELVATQGAAGAEQIGRAHTLVHEGILVCHEMVTLLNLIEHASQTDPEKTRRTFTPSLRHLAETTASSGWELRTICHEFESERGLAPRDGAATKGAIEPVSMGLLHDMAIGAHGLRVARREWFRAGQRLAVTLGTELSHAAAAGPDA
jgi:hypothetical protein